MHRVTSHHRTSLPANTVHLKRREVFLSTWLVTVCVSQCAGPSGPSHGRPGPSRFTQQSHAAVCMPVFPRSGSAPLRCARHMAHMACAMAEPDCGMWVQRRLIIFFRKPSAPARPTDRRWGERLAARRQARRRACVCRKQGGTGFCLPAGRPPKCQITPRAALRFGQPRSTGRLSQLWPAHA